jgi:hypothetical protein
MSKPLDSGPIHPIPEARLAEYRLGWRLMQEQKRKQRLERHARARQTAETAARLLRQQFGAVIESDGIEL